MSDQTYPLSKYLDPARDYVELAEELVVVDRYFHTARAQHEHRRFEYALALRALTQWREGKDYRVPSRVADVGGAGSPFAAMVEAWVPGTVQECIDPAHPAGQTLDQYLQTSRPGDQGYEGPLLQEAVFCLSVLEHVDDLDQFCYHLSCLVAPGGLLFLTMDAVDEAPQGDVFHFHWMRKRIFSTADWLALSVNLQERYHFAPLGYYAQAMDLRYPGPQVYDYSFASLALVKRR